MAEKNIWRQVQLINSCGLHLAGLFYSPAAAGGPVVIVCHGFNGGKEGGGNAKAMGEELGTLGFSTLLFDFSGVGESAGLFENITLSGQVDDLTSAVDWCVASGLGPIFTMGRSFGGTTVICQGAGDRRVAGVCTWAAPARLTEVFSKFAVEPVNEQGDLYALPDGGGACLRKTFFDDLPRYNVPALAGKLSPRPLLVVQGERDEVVDPADAGLIFAGAGEPKEILYLPGADHQFSQHRRQVWDACFTWLKKYMK